MKVSFVLLVILSPLYSSAQAPQKIGHADWEYILTQMPEYKKAENELTTFEGQLQNQMKMKNEELEAKYKALQELPANTPDAIRKDKESEFNYLGSNLQKFKDDAETSYEKKQSDLMQPLFLMVGKAVEDVARENGYAYIINPKMVGGGDVLLFADEQFDISDLVLKKLGIEPPKTPTAPK